MDPKSLIEYFWKTSEPEQKKYRTRLQQIREKNPSLMSRSEAQLRQKTKQLELTIQAKRKQKLDVSKDQEQLANNYSNLKRYDENPLYRANPQDEKRYEGMHRLYFSPKEAHDRLTKTNLDLGDLFDKAKYLTQNQEALTIKDKNGNDVPYSEALDQVAKQLGLSKGDAQRFLRQRLGGNVPKRMLTAAVRTDQTGEFDDEEQFTNDNASKREVKKQQTISSITDGPALKQIVKKLKPQVQGFTTAAEGRLRVQKQQLEAQLKTNDTTEGRKKLAQTYQELRKINADPTYLATPQEIQRNKQIVRMMLDPKAAVERLMDQNLDLADFYSETKQLEGQGSAARAGAKVRTLDRGMVDYDVAWDKISQALGMSRSDTLRFLKGHFSKDLRKLYMNTAVYISKQLPNGLDLKNLKEKDEGGLNDGQTSWSTAIQDDTIQRNPDLATLGGAEAWWRHIQDGWNNPISILANGIEGSRNGGHFRTDAERSDLENAVRFVADLSTQMLATAGPKVLGPKLMAVPKIANVVNLATKGGEAIKGLKGVQAVTNVLAKGGQALDKMGLAGTVLRTGGKFVAGNATGTLTEASKQSHLTGKSYGESLKEIGKGQIDGLFTLDYLFGHDQNGKALDFTERAKGLLNQGQQLLTLGHTHARSPQALKQAMTWVKDVEHLKDSPLVGAILMAQTVAKTMPKEQRAKFEAYAKPKLNEAAFNLLNPPKLSDEAHQHMEALEKELKQGLKELGHKDAAKIAKHNAQMWGIVVDSAAKEQGIGFEEAVRQYGRPTIHAVDESEIPTDGDVYFQRRTAKDALSEAQKLGWKITPEGHKYMDPLGRAADTVLAQVPRNEVRKGQTIVADHGDEVFFLKKTVRILTREANRAERNSHADSVMLPGTLVGAPEEAMATRIKMRPDQPLSGLQGAPKKAPSFNGILDKFNRLTNPKNANWFHNAGETFQEVVGLDNFPELMHAWAALSPGTNVPQNLQGALKALILKRQHPRADAEELTQRFLSEPFLVSKHGKRGNYGVEDRNAVHRMFERLLAPEEHPGNQGQKVSNYEADTTTAVDGGPRVTTTIDRHVMHFLGFDEGKTNLTPAQYRWANNVINAIAKRTGMQPHMIQSLMWAGEKMRKGQGAGEFHQALAYNPGLIEEARQVVKGSPDAPWVGKKPSEVPVGGFNPTLLSPSSARVAESIGDNGSMVSQAGGSGPVAPYVRLGIPVSQHPGSMSVGGEAMPSRILNLPHGDIGHVNLVQGIESILNGGPGRGIATTSPQSHRGASSLRLSAPEGGELPLKALAKLAQEHGVDFTQTTRGALFTNGGKPLPESVVKTLQQEASRLGLDAKAKFVELATGSPEDMVGKGLSRLSNLRRNPSRLMETYDRLILGKEADLKELGHSAHDIETDLQDRSLRLRGTLKQEEEGGIKGAFTFKPPTEHEAAQVAVYLTKGKADASTTVHEVVGHYLFEVLGDAGREKMAKAMGFSDVDTDATEQFVRHFERYVRDGRAPNAQLREAFKSFRSWLRQIYGHLQGTPLEKKIPREVRKKFEQMLGSRLEGGKNYRQPIGKTWGPPIPYKLLPVQDEDEDKIPA